MLNYILSLLNDYYPKWVLPGSSCMKMKDKVRRRHYQWFDEMRKLGSAEVEHLFIEYMAVLYHGTHLSKNRCAYYALKKYYGTTTIDELVGKLYGLY